MLPAIFVQSNALLATLSWTKVLPDTLMCSSLMPATLVQFFVKSNALLVTLARTKVLP